MRRKLLFVVIILAASFVFGPYLRMAPAETRYGTPDRPLDGERYKTMRALAYHLDETARGALEGASDDAQEGSSEARFLSAIRSFARSAAEFQVTLDNYPMLPFDVPSRVEDLATRARQVSDRIRTAGALENIYDDWEAVTDVLERMRLLLAGLEVEVPVAHVVAPLSGPRLQEFRQLARDLDISANGAHDKAKRELSDYPDRGHQFLGELLYFAAQSGYLLSRAATDRIDPQQIGPLVDTLLEDARLADRRMRDAQVFRSVWDDSGRSIVILQQMANLVRS